MTYFGCREMVDKSFITGGVKGVERCGRTPTYLLADGRVTCGACADCTGAA